MDRQLVQRPVDLERLRAARQRVAAGRTPDAPGPDPGLDHRAAAPDPRPADRARRRGEPPRRRALRPTAEVPVGVVVVEEVDALAVHQLVDVLAGAVPVLLTGEVVPERLVD